MPLSIVGNIVQWAGGLLSPAANTAGPGTEVMPVVRNQVRRFGQIAYAAQMSANYPWFSPWVDTNQTGDTYVVASAYANGQASAANGFIIQVSDDPSDSTFLTNVTAGTTGAFGTGQSVASATLTSIYAAITKRYWRIGYTQGGTACPVKIAYNASLVIPSSLTGATTPSTPPGMMPVMAIQPTAAALNATVIQGTAANLLATVNIKGNAAATLDAAINGAASTNALWVENAPASASAAACSLFQNSAVTSAVVVKASTGNLYGFLVNGGTSGNFLQFINTASAPALGTAAVFSIQIPSSGIILIPPGTLGMGNFSTGISLGISTTYNGAVAGTAASVVAFYL